MPRIIAIIISLIVVLTFTACKGQKKHNIQDVHTVDATIKETKIKIIHRKTIEGYLAGVSWEKNEVYVTSLFPVDNKCITTVIDAQDGRDKRIMGFPRGDSQSPTHFTNPSYVQFLDGKYFVFDHINKIVVYNSQFNYLYTGMYYSLRIFADFYTYAGNVYFMLGQSKNPGEIYRYRVQLYRFPEGKKPYLTEELYETHHESPYPRNGAKYYYIIFFRSSNWGFEKDGDIFYGDNRENKYYRYNLASKNTDAFELVYLKAREYSREEAEKAAYYKNMDRTVRGLETVIVPAEEATYHQGLYNVGKNMIGIVTGLDMDGYTFRLDIFDSRTGKYRSSIRLPFGEGFLRRTSSQNLGYLQTYINVDAGLYVWPDLAGEPLEGACQLTRFKITGE